MANEALVNQAIALVEQLISCLEDAERNLTSARNWGFIDIFESSFFADMIKYSKLKDAGSSMEILRSLKKVRKLKDRCCELKSRLSQMM